MKQELCVGVCPYCDGNGNLLIVRNRKNHNELTVYCDECLKEWSHPEINDTNLLSFRYTTQQDYDNGEGIEDATIKDIEKKGWLDYIYVLENGKWLKYIDKTKTLF